MSTEAMTYFAIPAHYVIGDAFETLQDALVEVGTRIENIRTKNAERGSLVPERGFVDERVKDRDGDRIVRRYRIEVVSS